MGDSTKVEEVTSDDDYRVERINVPGGWLYITYLLGMSAISTTFVADQGEEDV